MRGFLCPFVMLEQLLTSWQINNRNNLLLLGQSDTLLQSRLSARGRTVGEQLAHMHNNRIVWLEFVAKKRYQKTDLLEKNAPLTSSLLNEAFSKSFEIISQVIRDSWEGGGKLPGFKTGLLPFVAYLISHESHHRGNILLTWKQTGAKLPDTLKWELWDWQNPGMH
jgi:uncharacterized damage-inducible protein DinB